jgi:hypothetical protein
MPSSPQRSKNWAGEGSMANELEFEELAPGKYSGTVERVRYIFTTVTQIVITYKLSTPTGVRRVEEKLLISAPPASVSYFHTTQGLGRVEDILRIKGLTLADADGLKSLPRLLEGTAVTALTRNERTGGFNCPTVIRIEKP